VNGLARNSERTVAASHLFRAAVPARDLPPGDPTYGCDEATLRAIQPPAEVPGFVDFWQSTSQAAQAVPLRLRTRADPTRHPTHDVRVVGWDSFGGVQVGGWLLEPRQGPAQRAVIIGHGYGGRSSVQTSWLPADTVGLFWCAPGFNLSARSDIPGIAAQHVLHGIAHRDTYVIRACVASAWSATRVVLELFPQVAGRCYFHGISFSAGVGALALPWDASIRAAALEIATFGHHPWRQRCPNQGSGEAVRQYRAQHPEVDHVLAFYDAAVAARHIHIPVVAAPALADPMVPPPGQWAIVNGLAGPVSLCPFTTGHSPNLHLVREYRRFRMALSERFR